MTKKDEIYEYIRRQMALVPELARIKTSDLRGARASFELFDVRLPDNLLAEFLGNKKTDRRLVIMSGLRGVGKTTIMLQLYRSMQSAFEGTLPRVNILYVSADQMVRILGISVSELFDVYEEMFTPSGSFLHTDERYIFFIDEVHYDPKWAASLKSVFDRMDNVFLFASGSSALGLQKTADLARRAVWEHLPPLSFREFVFFKHGVAFKTPDNERIAGSIGEGLFLSDSPEAVMTELARIYRELTAEVFAMIPSVNAVIENYLTTGSFPSSLHHRTQHEDFEMTRHVLEKVIMDDFDFYDPHLTTREKENAFRLLYVLARSVYPRSTADMGKELGLEGSTVWKMLQAFEKAELVFHVKPYGSTDTIANKPWKYYFTAPSIASAILWSTGGYSQKEDILGAVLESAVGYSLHRQRSLVGRGVVDYYYDYKEKGADFIVKVKGRKLGNIAVEVGWGRKGTEQVECTMERTRAKYGMVISGNNEVRRQGNVVFIPKQLFLCL